MDMVEQQGIHAAMGGSFAQLGDKDYNSRKTEADKRMYDEKRRFYRDASDRRGRQGLQIAWSMCYRFPVVFTIPDPKKGQIILCI